MGIEQFILQDSATTDAWDAQKVTFFHTVVSEDIEIVVEKSQFRISHTYIYI